ncbi:PREDICTED: cell wall protein DAN4 [Rhagoletis zephyria]|uniref:cell wall protein DAN4 n=1 Tax=Rhagoletis zephyria TaxID=28612 RepID=UPI00081150A0|nr:PREDICTED: cell wall protein DAN4 [Rhagoletis zephyria]
MIRTGASLVVGGGDEGASNKPSYYTDTSSDHSALSRRRQAASSARTRTRRPPTSSSDESAQQQYWRGRVDDDNTAKPSQVQSRDDIRLAARKRKQPTIREPLAALEKEQKLYELRDKQRQEHTPNVSVRDKSYRRPYSQAKKESELPAAADATQTIGKTTVDLKHILKNAGGLSLSEILQQKNLSLDDLLKGKQNALQVLQSTAAAPSPTPTKVVDSRPVKPLRRIPYLSIANGATGGSGSTKPLYTDDDTGAEVRATTEVPAEDIEDTQQRSKLKLPALQRLKYFGSSSRGTTSQYGSTTRRAGVPTATSSTTTTTTTTTTRLPIYKKNFLQRSTLKPPFLLKNAMPSAPSSAEPEAKEVANSEEKLLTTTIVNNRYNREPSAVGDEEGEEHELTAAAEPTLNEPTAAEVDTEEQQEEEYLRDEEESNVQSTAKFDYEERYDLHAETTPLTTTTTSTTSSPVSTRSTVRRATTTPSILTTSAASATPTTASAKPALRAQLNFKTNSIDSDDTRAHTLPTSPDSDGLENFLGGETASGKRRGKPTTTVESITPRIDHVKPAIAGDTFSYQDTVPDFDGVDDRTDLLELIEDRRSGNRLFKVLEQRNMTLEELIEHRKRGSSQLHLATVVQNRSRFFPGQKVVLHDNMDIVTAFENFPHFNLIDLKSVKPDDIKTDSQGASYFTSIIDIEPTDEIYKDNSGAKGSAYQQTQRTDKSVGFFPSWKTLALASLASTTRNDASIKRNPFFVRPPQMLLESTSAELDDNNFLLDNETNTDTNAEPPQQQELIAAQQKTFNSASSTIDTVEAIENQVARAHDLLDLELSGHGFKRSPAAAAVSTAGATAAGGHSSIYANMPAGIRSAIVASAAIVLTSLATFLVVFVVCRWKQRRQRKTSYTKTYNAMKSKLPTVANASRRSSLRNMEELVGGISTVSVSPVHQLQRQSSLLFPRHCSAGGSSGGGGLEVEELSCGRGDAGRRSKMMRGATRGSLGNSGGIGSATGSTTSLALSLQSVHNSSTNKLNTMDPNSPEVQEYLFDALRKSY